MAASLAKRLRGIYENDEEERHDLANFSKEQVAAFVPAAFCEPIPAKEPLRLTFIVGGGKLVRHKYDEDLPRWLSSALREVGYEDDRGAALGSSKAFKVQHDLGQNLIYMHVFPAISPLPVAPPGGAGASSAGGASASAPASAAAAAASTPAERCLSVPLASFRALLASRVAPWSQRRRLLALLGDKVKRLTALEAKMVARERLDAAEQAEYDGADRGLLEEKIALLTAEMRTQVGAGALSTAERETVLREMDEKLSALRDEAGSGAARAEALAARRAALGDMHADTLAAIAHLAALMRARGTVAEADCLDAEAHAARRASTAAAESALSDRRV